MKKTNTGGMIMAKILEVCVDSYASATAAIAGGADRLELCSALAVGGLTPSPALLQQIREVSDIPVRCLMRTRGGDFLYTKEEIRQMALEISMLKEAGADGFVIGCLDADGKLDPAAMKPLLEAAKGMGLTLHRCIDVSRDLCKTYHAAADLGIDTILTSGGAGSCLDGMENIRKLIALREEGNGPEVLIGAGVKAPVISEFLKKVPGARAFHMSGKTEVESGMRFRREGVPMGLPGLDEWHIPVTSQEAVAAAKALLAE
jgi:copper homeostasis protein